MTHLNKISKIYKNSIAEKKDDSYLETDMKKRQANNEKARKDMEKMGTKMKNPHFEALDPVGKEDGDINNDGKKDKTDKYLKNRREKIGKAIAANEAVDKRDEAAMKKFQELQKKVDQKKKLKQEQFSDWRADLQEQGLIEVMDETEADKPIKEKKVNNKVKINPKLGEAIEEIGGTLIEEIEDHEFDEIVQSVYDELIEEGYSEEDVEDAIEFALTEQLNEVSDSYYDSAVKSSKKAAGKLKRAEMMKKAKGRLKFMKRKAGEVASNMKKKAVNTATNVAFAGSAVKDKVKTAMSTAKKRVTDAPKVAKKSIKDRIKQGALAVAKRMSEELSVDDQMKISQKYNRMTPEQRKAANKKVMGNVSKVAPKKDTRTDAQKMTDAVGKPRMGSSD